MLAFMHAVAFVLTNADVLVVVGVPAIAGVFVVVSYSVLANPGVPILAGIP
jgi:hypothetical protein